MTARTEDRVAEKTGVGTAYAIVGAAVPASTKWNTNINITNRHTASVSLRLYVADTSWSAGEPAAGTLKYAIAYDLPVAPGDVIQISGNILKTTEKLVARASVDAMLDIGVNAVVIT